MARQFRSHRVLLGALTLAISGCTALPIGGSNGVSDDVAQKALQAGAQIGVENGFGGMMMSGYMGHVPDRLGFDGPGDLADGGTSVNIELTNLANRPCSFHLKYLASPIDLSEHVFDVTVGENETLTVEIPCSEIIGLGSLTDPAEIAAETDDGTAVYNQLAVPGFLGLDYECGGRFAFVVQVDIDDLDEDGDTTEYVAVSAAMLMHLQEGGPVGHRHGSGMGMMERHGMMGF